MYYERLEPYEEYEPTCACPECGEECYLNKLGQIHCEDCDLCFDIPEPDFDFDDDEVAYGS